MELKDKVIAEIKKIYDPEIPVNIYDLGLIYDVKVNQDNVRNGFFELDWNKYFIEQLIGAGYGEKGDAEEQIVDRWFKDIVYNMFVEEGIDTDRGAGYINVVPIDQGKSEVS